MGFSSGRMEREEARKKKGGEEEEKKIQQVFTNIEKKVDLRAGQMREARAAASLQKKEEKAFEVDEKAVVLALNLGDALSKNPKALDRW